MRLTLLCITILLSATPLSAHEEVTGDPCSTDAHRAFDFWLGEWKVEDANGNFVGENKIVQLQNKCLMQENWISATSSFTGTSYNFYDSTDDVWRQVWIDNKGGNLQLTGNRSDNQMILQSQELKDHDGKPFRHRISWTLNEDGSVRQLWQLIKADDEISVAFDGLYRRKQE